MDGELLGRHTRLADPAPELAALDAMLPLYNTLLIPLRLAVAARGAVAHGRPRERREWDERLARRTPRIRPGGAWIHGASLGEARIVGDLARVLQSRRPGLPLAVSAVTPTGRARLPEPPAVDAAFFAPLDFAGLTRRVLDALRPSILVLVETELWPNLCSRAGAAGVPVVVVNGRLSPGRMRHYRRFGRLYRPLVAGLTAVGARTADDADRFVALGAPSVTVTGNVKYDLPPPRVDPQQLRSRLGLGDRAVLVAGSTARGEDEPVVAAFAESRRERPDLALVLAPRHPSRVPAAAELIRGRGLTLGRLSDGGSGVARPDVLLVDTVGELAELYGIAQVAFVGGSLVPVGGHNLLEPASAGVPVLFGPYTDNVAEPAGELERCDGGRRVRDATELAREVRRLLSDEPARGAMGRRALDLVRRHRGALDRSVALVLPVLDRAAGATAR